ncbi:MAG: hypothetical protein Q8930_19330, partial [Bacillota bacterium]|nr:hypothetical protein [Bacillota bacterium]
NFQRDKANIDIEGGVMTVPEVFGSNFNLGLSNLASMCHASPSHQWEAIISGHFESILEGNRFEQSLKNIITDFSAISKYLAVRIWPKSHAQSLPEDKLIYREDIEDTITTLVLDLPTSVRSLSMEEAGGWNISLDELFRLGMENVFNNYEVEVSEEDLNGCKCCLVTGEHMFTATFALSPDWFRKYIGKYGAIVGIPHRHALIVCPINGIEAVGGINVLIQAAYGMNRKGPGPVSPNIYWYSGGIYRKLPYEVSEGKFSFYPPVEFINLLTRMA